MRFTEKQADEIVSLLDGVLENGVTDYTGEQDIRSLTTIYVTLKSRYEVRIGPHAKPLLLNKLYMAQEAGECGYYNQKIITEIINKLNNQGK